MNMETIRPVIDAAAQLGFKPRLTPDGLDLVGQVAVGPAMVPLRARFADLALADAPRFYLPDTAMLGRKVVPHVDEAGELCVVDRRIYIFDRYQAPEQVLGLIVRAGEVLERGMTKAGTREIAEEFLSYWSSTYRELPSAGGTKVPGNLAHLTTAATLSFEAHQAKPGTLGELIDWASFWDATLADKMVAALGRLTARDPAIALSAPNGTIVATVMVSARGAKFRETLGRPQAWQRFVRSTAARSLPIERSEGRRTDLASLFGGNGPDGTAPLAGRTIVQIGCGAIGGYLARMLAQSGAGVGARFAIIDPEKLDRPNVRRHQLGLGEVGRYKAEGCAELVARDFPGVDIVPICTAAQDQAAVLAAADLVIDATGEQSFSDWLNAWALQRRAAEQPCPALLYSWIAGHGAAAQSFLSVDEKHACLRCLQPDLSKPGRFDPLKEPVAEPVAACGTQPVSRYGPAASMAAASLAASHAEDWGLGRPHHLLRTVRIDWEASVRRDPKSPDRSPACPACAAL